MRSNTVYFMSGNQISASKEVGTGRTAYAKTLTNILFIANDVDFLILAKTFLEASSSRLGVYTATHPEEVLPLIESAFYDIIVSDHELPGMTGLQLLERLRWSGNTLPFIMLVDRGREDIAVKSIAKGADCYVRKDLDIKNTFAELLQFLIQSTGYKLA